MKCPQIVHDKPQPPEIKATHSAAYGSLRPDTCTSNSRNAFGNCANRIKCNYLLTLLRQEHLQRRKNKRHRYRVQGLACHTRAPLPWFRILPPRSYRSASWIHTRNAGVVLIEKIYIWCKKTIIQNEHWNVCPSSPAGISPIQDEPSAGVRYTNRRRSLACRVQPKNRAAATVLSDWLIVWQHVTHAREDARRGGRSEGSPSSGAPAMPSSPPLEFNSLAHAHILGILISPTLKKTINKK